MAYRNYTLNDLKHRFQLVEKKAPLFPKIQPLDISPFLTAILDETLKLPKRSEKARSEQIILPILLEMKKRNQDYFTIYSGETLIADKKQGLVGECDFILAKNINSISMDYPLFCLIEAKKHDLEAGIGQCVAQMLGAKIYNQNQGHNIETIYGCVTNADNWQFLKLENNTIIADQQYYYFDNLPTILGVFQIIINFYKQKLRECK
ncbi:MAG: hypothetical protein KAU26_10130 [Methylococcales bacterium]|nr:hypothetical protein [Methylococcales bacterium]